MVQSSMFYNKSILSLLGASLLTAALTAPAQAYQLFFGEDINPNPGEGLLFGDIPNSRAAEAAFLAALTNGYATEDFESFEIFTPAELNLAFGNIATATLSGGGPNSSVRSVDTDLLNDPTTPQAVKDDILREISLGRNASSGTQYWLTNAVADFTVSFDQAVGGFGFYSYDLGDYGGTVALQLFLNGIEVSQDWINIPFTQGAAGSTDGSAFYFGLLGNNNQRFDQVKFRMNGVTGDQFAFDDMTIAKAVPEPGTLLALLGLGALGSTFLKRRSNAAEVE
ncbi:MAG: PEP-CTERM sorting domain-containing protein [Spirulina sp. DLM2.Bin59]|nr:MAG: PEP-CTERM sorting domain-containing protein [Spirulina sp. DLM2.Bin59]